MGTGITAQSSTHFPFSVSPGLRVKGGDFVPPNASRRLIMGVTVIVVMVLVLSDGIQSQKYTHGSGCWDDPELWSRPGPPTPRDDVVVAAGHTVILRGPRRVRSLTVETGARLTSGSPGVPVDLVVDRHLVNSGTIAGSPGVRFPETSLPGGSVVLTVGDRVDNHGIVKGGDGSTDAYGGMVRVHCRSGPLVNHQGARIVGGAAGCVTGPGGGEGGLVDLIATGGFENHGLVQGGTGSGSHGAVRGSGGSVYVECGTVRITGSILGGESGRSAVALEGPDGSIVVHGGRVALEGRRATLIGAGVTVQADGGPITLRDLSGGAIQATSAPLRLVSSDPIDLRSNPPIPVQRIYGFHGLTVLAESLRLDPGVRAFDLFAPAPALRRRARLRSRAAALLGRRFEQEVHAPDDPECSYQAATAFGRKLGLIIDDLGVLPLDPDPLFRLSTRSLPPFHGYAGRLDRRGRAVTAMDVPELTALTGIAVYSAAVVFDASGFRNLTSAVRVVVGEASGRRDGP